MRYYIHNHGGNPVDWVSMGIKEATAEADCGDGCYVNGYTRGQWATLTTSMTAASSNGMMILLQAQSPQNLNSNIYFDELEVLINGVDYVPDCKLATD